MCQRVLLALLNKIFLSKCAALVWTSVKLSQFGEGKIYKTEIIFGYKHTDTKGLLFVKE